MYGVTLTGMTSIQSEPLFLTALKIVSMWTAAEVGYRIILPLLGFSISYNESPIAIALYYFVWFAISVSTFASLFAKIQFERRLPWYLFATFAFGALMWATLEYLAQTGNMTGPANAPYTDLIFATPWYFLPKSVEILVQQTLITATILALSEYFTTIRRISLVFAGTFGLLHAVIYLVSSAPSQHATFMTLGAIVSALVFPYLILRVKNGFLYSYMIHWLFYAFVVFMLHTWPPPGYGI